MTKKELGPNSTASLEHCQRTAIAYLTRRDHSEFELTQKLAQKGFSSTLIKNVITTLHTKRLLNDIRFAENYTHYRRRRGYGPLRIIAELESRGIATETIAQVVEITDNEWFTAAELVWRKRFKNQKPSDMATRAKQMRFLHYRGFTREHINHLIK